MAGIWILGDSREQILELLTAGRGLADKLGVCLTAFLWRNREDALHCIACGADQVLLLSDLAPDQSVEAHIPIIADEAMRHDPDVFLIAATWRGKDLAARIAARLNAGLCSGCIALYFIEEVGEIIMERLAYGGAAVQRVAASGRPVMATISPGTFEQAREGKGREGALIRELPSPPHSPVKVLERKAKPRETKDLTETRVVIGVGRGFEKKEDLALARELAHVLGGEIGCTRPLAEDMHWLPVELCIGLSGVQVKPDLYLGLGVSGQIQHITGIRNAKVIAAVNKDENAPIFGVADLGIVGDLYDVVPELIRELKK